MLGAISGILRERKVLAVTGAALGLLAAIIDGGSTPLPNQVPSNRTAVYIALRLRSEMA